jgi:hypothetical protein
MTIKEAAQTAIDIQDACNLSGVLRAYSEAVHAVFTAADNTEARNRHPVSICFASKVADLAGIGSLDIDTFGEAFHACQELVDASKTPRGWERIEEGSDND